MRVAGLVIAGILSLLGVRSAVRWLRTDVEAGSLREQLLFAVHLTARVGLWFAFAGAFAGWALVEDPDRFGWYALVLLGLAGVQLLTAVLLSREPPGAR